MRPIILVIAIVCAYLAGGSIAHPFIDGDLFWQRELGNFIIAHSQIPSSLGTEVFSAVGAPWVAHEWLSSILVAVAFKYNALWILAVLTGLTFFATLSITALRARLNGASFDATALVILLGIVCLIPSFVLRVQIWVWPLFAALLLVLDFRDRRVWWSVPIIVAWANLHASAALALPVIFLDALFNRSIRRTRLMLCGATILALLCTPLGWKLLQYSIEPHPMFAYIAEWFPISKLTFHIVAGVIPLAALCGYSAIKHWKEHSRDIALTLLLLIWAVMHQRNIGLFAIAAMPLAALAFREGQVWKPVLPGTRGALLAAVLACVLIPASMWLGFGIAQSQPPIWVPPYGSVAALQTVPGEHRILCTNDSWCDVFLDQPGTRVFLDGRADPYPMSVWDAFITIIRGEPGYEDAIVTNNINSILARKNGPLDRRLRLDPSWRVIATTDTFCVLYIKTARV